MSGDWERDGGGYENGDRGNRESDRYESRRSQSPRPRSPGRDDRPKESENSGSNLFVSGIAPRMQEEELEEMFSKYGRVEKVNIMVDPHSRESRGFGFVKMSTPEEADSAKEALTGEERYGRVLTIEKARRARPRTPTPGKYFGPPKREPPRRFPARDYERGFGRDRYDNNRYDDRYYDPRRRDYDYDRYDRTRYDDRFASNRGYNRRDDYYYDSRR